MKPRAGQPQDRSPCPRALRAPARPHVRLSDTPRTGRAAEDVGPYHPSCPDAARRAKDSRRPRCRAFVADEVADEAARKPASKPFSVSPCLPVLRVNRPEARSPVRSRRSAPLPVHCRTSRAEGGPPRTSAPTTHPAPTRPGARRTRAAFGAGRPNGSGARRPQAGGSQFIATGAGRHPAGQHGARGDTKARRRLRVGLHTRQSRSIGFLDWGHTNPVAQKCAPSRFAVGRPAPGAARVLRAPGLQEVGDIGRRAFVADEVADEAARKPASKPFSVSPCLPVLRVNRPEAREEREAFHHVEQEYNPHAYAEYSPRRTGASHCWR